MVIDFSKRLLTDIGDRYIVNEAMVRKMGWENPLGKSIGQGKVIGVVKDFHYGSMHKPVEPFALQLFSIARIGNSRDFFIYLVLNISGNEIPRTLNFLEDKLAEFDPEHPFEFEFLDTSINELYFSETKLIASFAKSSSSILSPLIQINPF